MLLLFITAWIWIGLYYAVSFLLLAMIQLVSAAILLRHINRSDYILLQGVCTNIELTGLRKWVRSVSVTVQEHQLTIMLHHFVPGLKPGREIALYLLPNMPVYETENGLLVTRYQALTLCEPIDSNG